MSLPKLRSVRHKLLAVVLITTLAALVVALGASVAYNLRLAQRSLAADMATQSELLGHMTTPALAFDDQKLALQNLNLLRFQPRVQAAALYTAGGELFATYFAAGEEQLPSLPTLPERDTMRADGGEIVVFKRIVNNGELAGAIYLRADSGAAERMRAYVGIAVAVTILAMLIAFLLSTRLQRMVTVPIQAIAGVAQEVVAQRDYSRRAEKMSDDEVGALVDSFNNMLAEIERRTLDLERSNEEIAREVEQRTRAQQEIMRLNSELESRVRERTAQLQDSNEQLAGAKAMADKANQAKSEFLSSMSHELRTPLNAILGFTQLLASENQGLDANKRKVFTGYISKAGQHLLTLINEVLDLAKVESGSLTLSLEPVNLDEVVQECQELTASMAAAREVSLFFPPPSIRHVVADRTRLKQVLLNLLSNAIKYNRHGGSVSLRYDGPTDGLIEIAVIDTGTGLNEQQVAQLFQPFNRLGQEAGVEEGTGIGLVVTKRLVEMMGGQIAVSSTPGLGSTFNVRLPVVAADPDARTDAAGEASAAADTSVDAHAGVRTVLYVEDNPINLKLVEAVIDLRPDLRLLSAADGQLGVDMARAHQPDLILMDINLPGMSGNEALLQLQQDDSTQHIPVIAVTANAMPRDVQKGVALGFFRYLAKPIDIDALNQAMDEALALARTPGTAGTSKADEPSSDNS